MILGTGVNTLNSRKEYGMIVSFLLLLCLCVSSWGTCQSNLNINGSAFRGTDRGGLACYDVLPSCGWPEGTANCTTYGYCTCSSQSISQTCPPTDYNGGYLANPVSVDGQDGCWSTPSAVCYYGTRCTTQAEADSVANSLGHNACTDYKDDCESRGGVWDGQVVDDSLCSSTCDLCGTPESQSMREYIYNSCCEGGLTPQYTCGFSGPPSTVSGMIYSDVLSMGCNTSNWETNKICDAFYNESSSSETSSSSSGQSSSSVSEYCLIFPNDLACICAADSTNPDCDYLRSSSSQAEPGSSGGGGDTSSDSGGGGSPSSSGAGGVAGDDWEYDYRDSLHRIINATSLTARNTDSIEKHTGAIASILRSAKCLFEDCTNYDQLKVALDSSIVIPDGDTAGVIGGMPPLDSNMFEFLDAAERGDIYGIGPDSLNSAMSEFGEKVGVIYSDTGVAGGMQEIADLQEEFFPTSRWSGGGCPGALSSPVIFNLPLVGTVNTGKSLGTFVCAPLPGGLGINLGDTVRAIIRLVVTITMAFGIFRTATGFKNE